MNWVLDADIRDFFSTLDQAWLVKFLEHRIADKRVLRLIQKWLRAGILEDGTGRKHRRAARKGQPLPRCSPTCTCTTCSTGGPGGGGVGTLGAT